jgi:Holliday junction DNA helicase RuvB
MSKIVSRVRDDDDAHLDVTLRPKFFSDFIGQSKTVNNLKIYIEAATKRKEAIDHVLFTGLPGLGKTTLSYLVANSCGSNIKTTSGPALERPADLVGILTNLQPGEVFFYR